MPTHRQLLTEPHARPADSSIGLNVFSLGSADYATLRASFPASPAYNGTYGDAEVQVEYDKVFQGVVDDGGDTFGRVDRDYTGAPNLEEVPTGGGGLPGSPYGPNTAATAAGENPTVDEGFNYNNIPNVKPRIGGGGFGSGNGLMSPSDSSKNIARQKIGNLRFGKSTPT